MPSIEPDKKELPTIHVAVGLLKNTRNQVLLTKRAADVHQGGLWEFPGGKLEAGEDAKTALQRELFEELSVTVEKARPLIRVSHRYPDCEVVLHTWLVQQWRGEAYGKEGQPLAWVPVAELGKWELPAADRPVQRALTLPDRYLITPPEIKDPQRFLQQLDAELQEGLSLLQFRVFGLSPEQRQKLALETVELCTKYQAKMLLNGSLALAKEVGAHGVHLDRRKLARLPDRKEYADLLLSASCHDVQELQQAEKLELDFAVLSPVLPTQSHPDAEVLGWQNFKHLCERASLPVYALGGMSPEMMEMCWAQGAQGIAGIRGLWSSAPPIN